MKNYHLWIFFVLLEGLNIHSSVEGIPTGDYAERASNQSQLRSTRNIKSLPFIGAFRREKPRVQTFGPVLQFDRPGISGVTRVA